MKRPSKTKRIAKTKRRTPARKPAAAPTQITISERMLAAAAILVSDKDCGPDAKVTELFLSWSCLRVLQDVMFDHERDFGRRAHAEGRDEADCPALQAIGRTQRSFFPYERQLIQAMAAAPAETSRGLALKLLVWRWEGCHNTDGSLTDIHEIAAYAAYRDALNAADLISLAHPRDALTDALLAGSKGLEFDSDDD
jgi:hypothetical protein